MWPKLEVWGSCAARPNSLEGFPRELPDELEWKTFSLMSYAERLWSVGRSHDDQYFVKNTMQTLPNEARKSCVCLSQRCEDRKARVLARIQDCVRQRMFRAVLLVANHSIEKRRSNRGFWTNCSNRRSSNQRTKYRVMLMRYCERSVAKSSCEFGGISSRCLK